MIKTLAQVTYTTSSYSWVNKNGNAVNQRLNIKSCGPDKHRLQVCGGEDADTEVFVCCLLAALRLVTGVRLLQDILF